MFMSLHANTWHPLICLTILTYQLVKSSWAIRPTKLIMVSKPYILNSIMSLKNLAKLQPELVFSYHKFSQLFQMSKLCCSFSLLINYKGLVQYQFVSVYQVWYCLYVVSLEKKPKKDKKKKRNFSVLTLYQVYQTVSGLYRLVQTQYQAYCQCNL